VFKHNQRLSLHRLSSNTRLRNIPSAPTSSPSRVVRHAGVHSTAGLLDSLTDLHHVNSGHETRGAAFFAGLGRRKSTRLVWFVVAIIVRLLFECQVLRNSRNANVDDELPIAKIKKESSSTSISLAFHLTAGITSDRKRLKLAVCMHKFIMTRRSSFIVMNLSTAVCWRIASATTRRYSSHAKYCSSSSYVSHGYNEHCQFFISIEL
jgi:hypothetical protein